MNCLLRECRRIKGVSKFIMIINAQCSGKKLWLAAGNSQAFACSTLRSGDQIMFISLSRCTC